MDTLKNEYLTSEEVLRRFPLFNHPFQLEYYNSGTITRNRFIAREVFKRKKNAVDFDCVNEAIN